MIPPLKRFLKKKGLLAADDRRVFTAISTWARTTDDGRAWLQECKLSTDSFNVDHVIPQSLGGRYCIYNAHFMAPGTNAHLSNLTNAHKKKHVGETQVAIAVANARWVAKHAIDHSRFEADGLQGAIGRASEVNIDSDSWGL